MLGHVAEGVDEVQLLAGAEDGAAIDLHHLDIVVAQDGAVDAQLAEFVLDDANALSLQNLHQL